MEEEFDLTNPTPENLEKITKKAIEKVLSIENADESNGYVVVQTKHHPTIELRQYNDPITGWPSIRTSAIIPVSVPFGVWKMWNEPLAERNKWDPECEKMDVIHKFDENRRIDHRAYHAPFPVSGRDFICFYCKQYNPDGSVIMAVTSVKWRDMRLNNTYVRGRIIITGAILRPVPGDPTRSKCIRVGHIDPKAAIPTWVVNLSIGKAADSLAKLLTLWKGVEKDPPKEYPPSNGTISSTGEIITHENENKNGNENGNVGGLEVKSIDKETNEKIVNEKSNEKVSEMPQTPIPQTPVPQPSLPQTPSSSFQTPSQPQQRSSTPQNLISPSLSQLRTPQSRTVTNNNNNNNPTSSIPSTPMLSTDPSSLAKLQDRKMSYAASPTPSSSDQSNQLIPLPSHVYDTYRQLLSIDPKQPFSSITNDFENQWILFESPNSSQQIWLRRDSLSRTIPTPTANNASQSSEHFSTFRSSVLIDGIGGIEGGFEYALELLSNTHKRRLWDVLLKESHIVERFDGASQLIRLTYAPYSWWISSRSFLLFQFVQRIDSETAIISLRSYHAPSQSMCSHLVNGTLSGGFVIRKVGLDSIRIVCQLSISAGGWIDSHFVPFLSQAQTLSIHMQSLMGLKWLLNSYVSEHLAESKVDQFIENANQLKTLQTPSTPIKKKENGEVLNKEREKEREKEIVNNNNNGGSNSNNNNNNHITTTTTNTSTSASTSFVHKKLSVPSHYLVAAEKAFSVILEAWRMDGWEELLIEDQVRISRFVSSDKPIICRGDGHINAPVDSVLKLFREYDRRAEWDKLFDKGRVIEEWAEGELLYLMQYKGVWPTSPREFLNLTVYRQIDERTHVIAAKSVESEKCAPNSGYVRGECLIGGFIVVEDENNKNGCQVTYIAQADLKGSLPSSVVAMATRKNPLCVAFLRHILENN